MAKGNVNPNPSSNPGANPPPSTPPVSTGTGGGPTGNSGYSMSDSSMQGLQNKAGDLGSRLSSISSGLRGLNFSGNALGPIGLFAVPALNASNDNAIAQADKGAKAFTDVQSGLKATHQTSTTTDTSQGSNFRSIDPSTNAKPPPGATAPPPGLNTSGGKVTGPESIKGGGNFTPGLNAQGGAKHTGPQAVKGGGNFTPGLNAQGGPKATGPDAIKGGGANPGSNLNPQGGGGKVSPTQGPKGGGAGFTPSLGPAPGGGKVGDVQGPKGGGASPGSTLNPQGGGGKVSPTQGPKGGAGFTPSLGPAPAGGGKVTPTQGPKGGAGFTPSLGPAPAGGGKVSPTQGPKGGGAGFTPSLGPAPAGGGKVNPTQGPKGGGASFTPSLGKAPGGPAAGAPPVVGGTPGAPGTPGSKGGGTPGGGGKAGGVPTVPGSGATPGSTPGSTPGQVAGTKPSSTPPGPQGAVPPRGATPPAMSPGMAPPMAPGATPGATGGERGGSKFGTGPGKGVFDAPKPGTPDSTITKAPPSSTSTPPPAPKPTIPTTPGTPGTPGSPTTPGGTPSGTSAGSGAPKPGAVPGAVPGGVPGGTTPTTPGSQSAVATPPQSAGPRGGAAPAVTPPPAASPGMAPPMAPGATPGATGGERGGNKFGPGGAKGVFDAPKAPTPDNTITKAPGTSPSTPPPAPKPTPLTPQPNTNVPPAASAPAAPPQSRPGTPPPVSTPPVSSPNTAPPAQAPAATAPPQSRPGTPVSTPPVTTPSPAPNTNVPPSRTDTPAPAQTPRSDTPPAQTRPAPPTTVPPANAPSPSPATNVPPVTTPNTNTPPPRTDTPPPAQTPRSDTPPAQTRPAPPTTVPPANAPSPSPATNVPPVTTPNTNTPPPRTDTPPPAQTPRSDTPPAQTRPAPPTTVPPANVPAANAPSPAPNVTTPPATTPPVNTPPVNTPPNPAANTPSPRPETSVPSAQPKPEPQANPRPEATASPAQAKPTPDTPSQTRPAPPVAPPPANVPPANVPPAGTPPVNTPSPAPAANIPPVNTPSTNVPPVNTPAPRPDTTPSAQPPAQTRPAPPPPTGVTPTPSPLNDSGRNETGRDRTEVRNDSAGSPGAQTRPAPVNFSRPMAQIPETGPVGQQTAVPINFSRPMPRNPEMGSTGRQTSAPINFSRPMARNPQTGPVEQETSSSIDYDDIVIGYDPEAEIAVAGPDHEAMVEHLANRESAYDLIDSIIDGYVGPVTTTDYQVASDGVEPQFVWQSTQVMLEPRPGQFPSVVPVVETGVAAKPPMMFSSDNSIGLPLGRGGTQFREFYATPEVIADAQARLKEVGSKLELKVAPGNTVRYEDSTLLMVKPHFASRPPGVCSEFSQGIIGGTHSQAIMRPPGGAPVVGKVGNGGPLKFNGMHEMAFALAHAAKQPSSVPNTLTPQQVADVMVTPSTDPPLVGAQYGAALVPGTEQRAKLDAAAEQLGLNQFAWAKPGEAYMIQSIAAPDPGGANFGLNYTRTGTGQQLPQVWGYHLGSVVVNSAADDMQITVETVRQGGYRKDVLDQAIGENLRKHQHNLAGIEAELRKQPPGTVDAELMLVEALTKIRDSRAALASPSVQGGDRQMAETTLGQAAFQARLAINKIAGPQLPQPGEMWFLNDYGKQPGQSFFDKWGHVDDPNAQMQLANPLVAVSTSHQNAVSYKVPMSDAKNLDAEQIAAGVQQLPGNANGMLTGLAKTTVEAALWRHRNGMPLPEIQLHGYSNNRTNSAQAGQQRADAAAAWTRSEVARLLDELQRDVPPERRLDAGQIPVNPISHGREVPPGSKNPRTDRRNVRAEMVIPDTTSADRQPAARDTSAADTTATNTAADVREKPLPPLPAEATAAESSRHGAETSALRPAPPTTGAPTQDLDGGVPPVPSTPSADTNTAANTGKKPVPSPPPLPAESSAAQSSRSGAETSTPNAAPEAPKKVRGGGAPPAMTPPTPESHRGKDVLSDESWRHDPARTAEWSNPDNPADRSTWADRRNDTDVRTVDLDVRDIRTDSTPSKIESYKGLINYDLRRIETSPGKFVQEYTVKVHLEPTGKVTADQLAQIRDNATTGVDNLLNQGFRLPSGDQFHVNLEFTDNKADAHTTVKVDPNDPKVNQDHWNPDTSPEVLAHETLHYLGIPDEYKDTTRVLQQHDTNSGVHDNDGGLMGSAVHLGDPGIRPRHLWLIERTANSQVMVPDTRLEPAGPATVPPPAGWTPKPPSNEGPVSAPGTDGTVDIEPDSDSSLDADLETRPATMPGRFYDSDSDVAVDGDVDVDVVVRPNQTHLPNLDRVGLVESVLRSAAFQNAPVPNASPLVGSGDVRSTVDTVLSDVRQNPQNHNHPGLTPPALANWVANQVSPDTLAKFHPDLEPNTPGLTPDAKTQQWRANLADDLANGSSKRWDVVNAGPKAAGTNPGNVEVINHLTQQLNANGALPSPADLVAKALQTPSWADSHVGSHLPDSIAQALDVQLVVDNNGVQTVHGPDGATQVQINSQNGTFGALGAPSAQEVRAGMEAWLAGKSSAEVTQTIADLYKGRQDEGLYQAAQKVQLVKRATAHPGGPQAFVNALRERASTLENRIAEVRSQAPRRRSSLWRNPQHDAKRAQVDAQVKTLTDLLDSTNNQIETLAAQGPALGTTHLIDNFVAGPNADKLEHVPADVLPRLDAQLTAQITAAENAGFDASDLKMLQERVRNEADVRTVTNHAATRGLDGLTSQLDDAREALQNYRAGKSSNTGIQGFLNQMLGQEVDTSVDFDQKIAQAETLVQQAERNLSFVSDPDYSNRFEKSAEKYAKLQAAMQRLDQLNAEIDARGERLRDLDARTREFNARQLARALEEQRSQQDAESVHSAPGSGAESDVDARSDADAQSNSDAQPDNRVLTPRHEHAAFRASLYGKSQAELAELAEQHSTHPDRSFEIEQMSRYQEIAHKEGGLQQHLRDLQSEIRQTREEVRDLKRTTDALPDVFKSELMRTDQAQRQAEQQRLTDHARQLDQELMRLQYDRTDALTTYALNLPADTTAPEWQTVTPVDAEIIENRVTDLIRDARIGGLPTPELDRLYDQIREIRMMETPVPSRPDTPVPPRPDTPTVEPADSASVRSDDSASAGSDTGARDRDTTPPVEARQEQAAPAAEPRPFMQDPSARSAGPDMDLVVPGGFGPVHEGTPQRSFEASLYGLDTAALRDLQQTYGRDAARSAAIEHMIEVSRQAGPPAVHDQRTRIAEQRLDEMKTARDRWNASDIVPDRLKTQTMLDEQANRREAADRQVEYYQQRVDQLTNNRDAALTTHALQLPADVNAPAWRQFGDADLAAVRGHVDQQIRDAQAGGHNTAHLEAFLDFTNELQETRQNEDADTRPAPEPETRPAPPRPTPNPVIPMTTMAPQPVGQLPDTNLPSFFQDNKALGSIVPTDVRGADAVVREINGLRPDDATRIKNAIENDFETFLGDGRNFQVKIGNAWFEANVRAEMHADGSSTTDAANTKVDKNYQAAAASTTTNSISTSNDVGGAVTAGVAMGPYGSLGGKGALATPAVSQATSTSITEQRAIKGSDSGSKKITVPVSYEITLYDASGNPSLFSTLSTGPDVTLQVPTDLSTIVDSGKSSAAVTPPDAAWGLKAENAVPEAVVVKDSGKLFNDVAENLHPSITKIGSPGREALQNFLSPTSIRNNLPAMLGGFVTSPDLISPHASKGAAVQMKATLKDAKLVGTHADAALDLKDTFSWGSSVSASSKTGFDVTAGFGGNIGVPGKVGGTVGATGGYSARTAEGVNAGTSSSRKSGIGVKAETGLYEVTAEVEVQGPAGKPVTMEITTHMRMGLGEAGAVGLPTPVGTRNSTTDPATADTRFLPPYVADTLAAGNAKVGEFAPATQVQNQVETKLRELPGFEKFLPKWTNPDANPRSSKGQGFGDVAAQLANQRKLDANLSPAALKANMDSLLGPGVQVQLKNSGKTTNTYVNVTVKAKLTNPKHLGKAEGRPVSDSSTSGPKLDANTSTTKGWTGGITGRANIPVKTGVASLTPMPQAGVSYSHSWTDKTSAGPAVSATSSNPGSPDAQVFQGDVEFEVEITTFTRPRTWVRTIVPGAPGRHAPDVKTVAKTGAGLNKIDGKVNLWVSDSSTLKDDPGDGFKPGDPSATPIANSPTVKDLLNPGQARPKSPEFLHVEAVANTTELRDQAIDALNRAAKGDSALTTPGTASRAQIDKMFAPENIKANLQRLIETGVQEQGLKYDRRVADRSGALGMSVKLGGAKLVSISDATGTDNSVSGGYKAGGSSTTSRSVDLVGGINVPVRPNVTPPPAGQPSNPSGSGGVAVTGKWTPWSDNKTTANEIGGNVDRGRTTPDDAWTVLVQVDAEFTIVGESRTENFVHGGTPNAEGVKVNLPKSVFVRVSEDVAREMGVLPKVAPNVPKPDFPKMAPPSTVAPGEPGALGLSNVEKVPDLSSAVNELTTKLSTNTKKFGSDALIPDSVLKDSMSNLQRIVDLNSPSSVKAMIDSALDGGVPLLVHQPGTFGKDSYQVTLRAKAGEPKFDQVVNDGVDMSHNDGGSRKDSDGKGRGTGWGLGLRAPGLASPGSANPNVSGTAGVSVIANVGSAQSSSVTTSTSMAFGHNRTASGPAARYNVPVEFELVVEKGDKEVAKVRSAEQDMVVRTHADNQKVSEPTTGRGTPQPYMSAASRRGSEFGTPEATYAFQQDSRATQLPATASVENLRGAGDLRDAAVKAMTGAGAGKGLTGKGTGALNSLLSTLSPENLQPHLPAMLSGPLDVPGLKEAALTFGQDADVKVYAKLVNPQLGSLSDGVKIETPLTTKTVDVSSEAKVADTSDVAVGVAQGSAAVKQGDPKDTVNFGTGGVELKHANEDSSAVSGGPAQAEGGGVKPKDPSRTGLVQFDVEYRVVATIGGKTGVVDLTVPGSAGVRMPATEVESMLNQTFSDSLKDAQTEVKKTADDWREAEKKVDEARHEAQEVINSAAAVLARTDQPLGDAATKLNTAIENHVNAEAELRTRQTEFDTAVADVARTRADIQDLTPRISSLSQDALATKDALDDAQIGGAPKAELDRLGQEADAAHTALTNAQQQLTDAHTQLDVQRKTAVDARAELQAQQKAVADAETARTDAEEAHKALTAERAEAENKIKDAETKLDDARRAADAEQKKWWDAKAEADRQVDLYNATPPPTTPPPAPPAPSGDATTNTPARDAATNTPPANATPSTPAHDAVTNTPPGNATTNTPARDTTTNTPPADANTPPADTTPSTPARDAAANTPPADTNTNTPPADAATNTPPGNATTNTPARDAATNTPARDAATNTPARDAATNTPARDAATNTPPADTATNTPPADTNTNTPPADAATNTPAHDAATNTPPADTTTGPANVQPAAPAEPEPQHAAPSPTVHPTTDSAEVEPLAVADNEFEKATAGPRTSEALPDTSAPDTTTASRHDGATEQQREIAEAGPATRPEQKAEVDAPAVSSALAAPPADQDATEASRAGGAGERTASGQPVAAPQLPGPDLGKPFVEDLFDEIDAKTSAAPRPARLRDSVQWRVPEDAASLTPDRLEQEFGIPRLNQERFQNFVDRFNIVLDVRPTNPDSVRWLHDGAMPKPKDIKAKTINQADVLLGADAEHVGLVGFFQPDPNPDLSGVDPAMRDKVAKRFNERAAEFAELIGTMEKYEREGKFKVIDGVVHGANSRGDLVWVTGDADMYGMYDTEGNRLSEDDYEGMVFLLVNRNVGVQHGAHLYWDPATEFDRKIFDTIVNRHATEEPLVRFAPGRRASLVLADPVPPRADANSQVAPTGAGGSERHEVAEAAPPSRLSQYEEHVSSTRRHLRHLAFDVLNRPAPPPVTPDGLYAAVGEVVRQDPAALRAQVLNHAATTAAVSQATADFTAARPVHTGHLTGALVENANWRMHADANENAGAANARDLLGHLIATRLGTTLVVHQGTGAAPLVLAPMGDHAGVPVEVDVVVADGRVTYRPHQPLQRGV
ncbi:hypothetical protein [Lentzea jiangxiensis]|uniref:Uncharacterized coiled-coil protein, contains DUF342 domain n=1 Tax=Lentzea jiangxiensis TaxID=641025 RepID=A0A1H0LTX4_9PSEU|nr:hypothetical protein [Lentzea jiangxiensis]SDO71642.1 Uncharacterized coiled-coil protein, contains DUF342 domain [Lentzea jiangxiensis]